MRPTKVREVSIVAVVILTQLPEVAHGKSTVVECLLGTYRFNSGLFSRSLEEFRRGKWEDWCAYGDLELTSDGGICTSLEQESIADLLEWSNYTSDRREWARDFVEEVRDQGVGFNLPWTISRKATEMISVDARNFGRHYEYEVVNKYGYTARIEDYYEFDCKVRPAAG